MVVYSSKGRLPLPGPHRTDACVCTSMLSFVYIFAPAPPYRKTPAHQRGQPTPAVRATHPNPLKNTPDRPNQAPTKAHEGTSPTVSTMIGST